MKMILPFIIGLVLLSVVGVLILGIVSMVKGGEFNEKHGNKLMRARVALQGLTLLLLALAFYMSQN